MTNEENIDALRKIIEASGGLDRYVDEDEEKTIFQEGEKLGLVQPSVANILNQICRRNQWTRELDIKNDLRDQLDETIVDDGSIDQGEFEHCVNYAVAMNMPRRRATELCVRYVTAKNLKIKKPWLGKDWFALLRKQYGL